MKPDFLAPSRFGIGRVLGQAFILYRRHWRAFLVLGGLCALPNFLLRAWLGPDFWSDVVQPILWRANWQGTAMVILALWVVGVASFCLLAVSCSELAIRDGQGRKVSIKEALIAGFKAFPRLMPIAFLLLLILILFGILFAVLFYLVYGAYHPI